MMDAFPNGWSKTLLLCIANKGFKRNNQNIELFYNLFNERNSELNYIKKGIQRIEFIINPPFKPPKLFKDVPV